MKTVAIIQARNGGSRLPNKGSIELLGKPMLQHVVERVRRARRIDEVIVAMPGAPEDEPLGDIVFHKAGAEIFSARHRKIDDADLVKRYFLCAKEFGADLIVRVCADNPMIDPNAIDLLIANGNLGVENALVTNAGDYRTAERNFGWPDGFGAELYTMKMLEWLDKEIKKPELCEHPHKYYHNTHNVIVPPCPNDWRWPELRLDVNNQADYERVKEVFEHFGHNEFGIGDVITYLDSQK